MSRWRECDDCRSSFLIPLYDPERSRCALCDGEPCGEPPPIVDALRASRDVRDWQDDHPIQGGTG